jgi:hypothetical protein
VRVRIPLWAPIGVLALRILSGFFVLVVFLHGLLGIAKFCLGFSGDLIRHALCLLRQTANGFAGHFLHLTRHFFGAAFDLIFVDAHDPYPRVLPRQTMAREAKAKA